MNDKEIKRHDISIKYHADRCIEAAQLLSHAYDDISRAFDEILNDLDDKYIMAGEKYPYKNDEEFPMDSHKVLKELLEAMEALIEEADAVSKLRIKDTKENINMVMGMKQRFTLNKRIEKIRSRMYYY